MEVYQNLGGNSSIHSFEIEHDSIIVQFDTGSKYLYNDLKPGAIHVQRMKALAKQGKGLSSYINKYVRNNYAKRIA